MIQVAIAVGLGFSLGLARVRVAAVYIKSLRKMDREATGTEALERRANKSTSPLSNPMLAGQP